MTYNDDKVGGSVCADSDGPTTVAFIGPGGSVTCQ